MSDPTRTHGEQLARCVQDAHAANERGHHEAAIRWCQKALRIAPDLPEAWYNLGIAQGGLGQAGQARQALLKAASLASSNPEAQNSVGLQFLRLGDLPEAERCLERAVALAPDLAIAQSNLGLLRNRQGRTSEAVAAFRNAVARAPRLAAAHANLGGALNAEGDPAAGAAACRQALALDPELAVAWCNLGNAAFRLDLISEAQAACRKALELDPGLREPRAILADVLMSRGAHAEAREQFDRALRHDPNDSDAMSSRLYCANFDPALSPARMLHAALQFGKMATRRARPFASWSCTRDPDRKLKVGLVSGDFRHHPVGHLLQGPLREFDRAQCGFVAYSNNLHRDELTTELRSRCEAWIDVAGETDAALARRIHADGIDLLIDLSGHTARNRLAAFAWKPAPVQLSWLGYFATTGLKAIDWKLGDPVVTPAGEEDHFTERIWRLPESCFCFPPPRAAPAVVGPPCRGNGFTTYGCFNNLAKLNDAVIALWSRLLQADATSLLLLKSKQLASPELRRDLLARFERQGIAAQRLVLEGPSAYGDYLAAYGRVDVALDPFPFSGGMTTAESLWMGVPVVTRTGDRYVAHQGESLLRAAGLSAWIAASDDEYLALAQSAARDPEALAGIRHGLRAKVAESPLFDARRHARHLQEAFRGMWIEWCGKHR